MNMKSQMHIFVIFLGLVALAQAYSFDDYMA
jgi:hypothetical protein